MPVSSLSGSLSTSVYFASLFLLLFVLSGPVGGAYADANQRAAQQVAAGVAAQINRLAPGMETELVLRSAPGVSTTVDIDGTTLTAVVDGHSASAELDWSLGRTTLTSGTGYVVTIALVSSGQLGYVGEIRVEA